MTAKTGPFNREQVRSLIAVQPRRLMHVVGEPVSAEVEIARRPDLIDHVWLTVNAGDFGPVRAAIATWSKRNAEAGFDERMRLGSARIECTLPHPQGVFSSPGLDYDTLEASHNIFYEYKSQQQMEEWLLTEIEKSDLIEIWGRIYTRKHIGVHEIHSMRASCAVPEDERNHDGAMLLHRTRESTAKWCLLKFCGQ